MFEDTEHPPIPILSPPFKGDWEEFDVNIMDTELEGLKDSNGVLWFKKVMEWCLPQFDDDNGGKKDLDIWIASPTNE